MSTSRWMYKILIYLLSSLSSFSVREFFHEFRINIHRYFSCIIHLNQHHDAMKNDIHRTINDAENHRVLLEQQINKIKQQQTSLNDLYEREIKNLNNIHEFLTNICENNYLLISEYERYIKQFELIKENQANNSFIQAFILQIDQILQQQNQFLGTKSFSNNILFFLNLESKDEISITTNILSALDNETTIVREEEEEEEELIIDSIIDCHSNELSIGNTISNFVKEITILFF